MTVIELFDVSPLQNLSGALSFKADKIYFLGSNIKKMTENSEVYEKVIRRFNPCAEIKYVPIKKYDMNNVSDVICKLAENEKQVIIDVSGGDDYVLAGAGIAACRCEGKGVQAVHISVRSGAFSCYGKPLYSRTLEKRIDLTCDELISLHGGKIVYTGQKKSGTYRWDFESDGFEKDVRAMWNICRADCRAWNKAGALMGELESFANSKNAEDDRSLTVNTSYYSLKEKGKRCLADSLDSHLLRLSKAGLVRSYVNDGKNFGFEYKSAQVRQCLVKAGTVLELMTYLAAKSARTKKGFTVYDDALSGVVLDWDGKVHLGASSVLDTENEIDVLLVKGMIPYFVSCKNGNVDENELYKLSAVAAHFGVKYAKKILVATDLQKNYSSLQRFIGRAKEMNIKIIDGVHKMTFAEFSKKLANI